MKATLKNRVIAESDDIVSERGYHYFPNAHVRLIFWRRARRLHSTAIARMASSSTT